MATPRRTRAVLILLTASAGAAHTCASTRHREVPVCSVCQLSAETALRSITDPAPVPAALAARPAVRP